MRTFCRLSEDNEWEGERWDFWLQLTGNEEELGKFADLLRAADEHDGCEIAFSFHPEDVETEAVVDKLVEYAMPGYMDSANKITGKFTCPDSLGDYALDLYKGGINDYFKAELG